MFNSVKHKLTIFYYNLLRKCEKKGIAFRTRPFSDNFVKNILMKY